MDRQKRIARFAGFPNAMLAFRLRPFIAPNSAPVNGLRYEQMNPYRADHDASFSSVVNGTGLCTSVVKNP
jgi:hypothetical protein